MPPLMNTLMASMYLGAILGFVAAAPGNLNSSAFLLWTIHYARRVLESIFVFRYTRRNVSSVYAEFDWWTFVGSILYYSVGGGFAVGLYAPSKDGNWVGIALFVVGEIGNGWHHLLLGSVAGGPSHVRLRGGLFNLLQKPHYFFEELSWIGYAIAFPCSTSILFAFLSAGAMTNQIMQKKNTHKDAVYWMIPFVY